MDFIPCGSFKANEKGSHEVDCSPQKPVGRAVYFNLFSYYGLDSFVACELYVYGNREYITMTV